MNLVKFQHSGDETNSPNVCTVGNFNTCPKKNFGELLFPFCSEHDIRQSNEIMLPVDSFTYVSDIHGSCSWLDLHIS